MIRPLKAVIAAGTLGIFALVLSGVLFCAVSSAGMPGMEGMDARQCPAALELHFETLQTLTGAPLNLSPLLALIAFAGVAALIVVSVDRTASALVRPSRLPAEHHWLRDCFRRGILHPKIY